MNQPAMLALRMERHHLTRKADEDEYNALYRDLQPGHSVYWNGFGDPPSLTYRAAFDDIEYNRARQADRELDKGRFGGGNIGWVDVRDLELFACLYHKPLTSATERQLTLLDLIERMGPLTIHQMSEETELRVKTIAAPLHRLQEAFLVYEDQNEGQWDRGWYRFGEMFPDVSLTRYSRLEAYQTILERFAYRIAWFDADMARSFYKLPLKDTKAACESLVSSGILMEYDNGYILTSDYKTLRTSGAAPPRSVFAIHRSDFLYKANEHSLKGRYPHQYHDTLYYLLIDGQWRGAIPGRFRYTPELDDVILDLPADEAASRKGEIIEAIASAYSRQTPRSYMGIKL